MKTHKWPLILLLLCLLAAAAPAAAFAQETAARATPAGGTGSALQAATETDSQAGTEAEPLADGTSEVNTKNILLHIAFVMAVMAVLITIFIIIGKKREEQQDDW